MESSALYYDYEQVLIGNKDSFAQSFFSYGPASNEKSALIIMKFAFEKYLCWSPEEIRDNLTMNVLKKLKLDKILRYVIFPPELEQNKDLFYLAVKIYPGTIKYDRKALVLRTYKRVLSGDLYKFPKGYLSGYSGEFRACLCFQYMLSQPDFKFDSVKSIYKYFSEPIGNKMLNKYRLFNVCGEYFGTALEYVHEALPEDQKSELWYNYYKFKKELGDRKDILL